MAIGDTVQAGLGRMDFSAFQTAGAAQARANQAFGNALGQAATAYFAGKEKKERANEMTQYLMGQGASEEDAKAIAKNPFLQNEYQRKQAADQQMQIAKMQDATRRAEGGANRAQVAAKMEDEQNLRNELKQGKREMDNIFLMANAPSYTDDFGQFNQETGNRAIDQSSPEAFLKTIREANVMPQTDVGRGMLADELRRMRDASIPKTPTINEQIALDKRAEEVAEKKELKASEERQRESLLNETNDILEIIRRGKDVTGQVEGLDFVRALKKSVGYGKEDEKLRRKLERYANKFTLENVSKLKGPLSEKELAFIQQSSPKITDEPEVWVDFLTGLEEQLNTESQGQIPQVNPSAPASQSLLDEIERKRQLRSQRAGL
jgi:hypothetical protein